MKHQKLIVTALFLASFVIVTPALAAFALVQASAQAIGTGATLARSMTSTTARNLIVCNVTLRDLNETLTSVTDDKGNSYSLSSVQDASNNVRLYQAWSSAPTGGVTSVTANFSAAVSNKGIRCEEYSGAGAGQIIVRNVGNQATGLANGSLAVSTFSPAAGELVVASMSGSGSVTWTAGANYLMNDAGTVFTNSEYRLSSGGSETAPATNSGAGNWAEVASSFKLQTQADTPVHDDWWILFME